MDNLQLGGAALTDEEIANLPGSIVTGEGPAACEGYPVKKYVAVEGENLIWLIPQQRKALPAP